MIRLISLPCRQTGETRIVSNTCAERNPMNESFDQNAWVFVVVQKNGQQETIVGQQDPQNDISFIPAFRDRDNAMQGIHQIAKEPGQAFEIQAIIYDDLVIYARTNGYLIFILDGSGRILKQISP
jgi:hypothetical protein